MSLVMIVGLLAAGFVVLAVAGDFLVGGSAALARRLGVAPLVVGLTVVAFGTSAPEMLVSVQAVLSGEPGLALGNVVGSNIANILIILAVPTIFAALPTTTPGLRHNTLIMLIATAVFILLCIPGSLGMREGLGLLAGIALYTAYQVWHARRHREEPLPKDREILHEAHPEAHSSWPRILISIVGGLIGLPIGGALIVNGGVGLAEMLNVPSTFVGLTIVAVGTSLPELAASTMAAIRKQADVAIGNVVGSNIFNVLAVAGATAVAGRVPTPPGFFELDLPVMAGTALLLMLVIMLRKPIGRLWGLVFVAGYVLYVVRLSQVQGLI
jgi:cation:H+ antiporter